MAEWAVPPQTYNSRTARLDIARGFMRYALKNNQTLVFRLIKAANTSTGYQLNYKLSFSEPYLAISHAWTDRSGHGDACTISDLAPWPITMSPAKLGFLDWLFKIQDAGEQWTSWYWLDLFCIDQTKQDELLFSQQLQQIPQVFFDARSCIALLASWPCESAQRFPDIPDSDQEDGRYEFVDNWLQEHTLHCCCPAPMDAWLTRVWTRQEVLYSRNLTIVTANLWLAKNTVHNTDSWKTQPTFYQAPRATHGIKELSSCLVTWSTKYGLKSDAFSSSILADMLRLLIRGETVECFLLGDDLKSPYGECSKDWFAFNWTITLNFSTRFTSHVRDAILSQMLLLPGYKVPQVPWSMPLQDLMVDSCRQYKQILGQYQLVPMLFDKCIDERGSAHLAPKLSPSLEKASLHSILQAVGSPCTYPRNVCDEADLNHGEITDFSIIGYEVEDEPRFRVLHILDLDQNPLQAAKFFAMMSSLWDQAEDCTTTWNMRECLKEIEREMQSDRRNPESLKTSLKHYIGRLTHNTAFQRTHINLKTDPSKPYNQTEIDSLTIPRLVAVEISYAESPEITPYPNLLFEAEDNGDTNLTPGEEGLITGLGIDKVTYLEFGFVAAPPSSFSGDGQQSDVLRIRASGALMPIQGRNRRRLQQHQRQQQQRQVDGVGGAAERRIITRPVVGY